MENVVIYCDGGSQKLDSNSAVVSCGLVAIHDDQTIEFHKHHHVDRRFQGLHELIAFIHAVNYVKDLNPNRVSFYVDDEDIGYAAFFLHQENFQKQHHDRIISRVLLACQAIGYSDSGLIINFLKYSRIVKVRGHRTTVYNLRADYLACHSRQEFLNNSQILESFESWLEKGFDGYTKTGELFKWYPPFSERQS